MQETISQIMAIVGPTLVTAIGIFVTWGLNELRKFVKSKTNNEAVDLAFKQLDKIASSAVIRAELTMKEFAADGKITKNEAVQIKKIVFDEVKRQIPKGKAVMLKKCVNDVDDLIDSKIEEIVYKVKQERVNQIPAILKE
jgi:hypothetical protein